MQLSRHHPGNPEVPGVVPGLPDSRLAQLLFPQ